MSKRKRKTNSGGKSSLKTPSSFTVSCPSAEVHTHRDRKTTLLLLAAILAFTAGVYSNTFQNGFTNWDDGENVYENVRIREINTENLKFYFTKPLLAMYTPLVYLSYALDYKAGGLDPFPYHVTNLLLHMTNVALVFFIVRLFAGNIIASVSAALIFAVHPMNEAGVAPVSVRSSLLCSMFYLGAFVCYIKYVKQGCHELRHLVGAGALFVLSLLSKSAAVVFPLLMFLTDYYLGRRFDIRSMIEKIPFFALSIAFGILTIIFRSDAGHIGSMYVFGVFDRFFLVSYALVFYPFKLLLPLNLSAYYMYPEKIGGLLPYWYYAAPLFIAAVLFGIAKAGKYRKPLFFGLLFYLIHIALVLKIVPMGNEMLCDRYAYLPCAGLLTAAAGIFFSHEGSELQAGPVTGRVIVLLAVGCAALFSWMTYDRNAIWKDSIVFYTDIINKAPRAAFAYSNRGQALLDKGAYVGALDDLDRALSLDGSKAGYYNNRGLIRSRLKDYKGAVDDFNMAISRAPDYVDPYNNRGLVREILEGL